jgi:hypothetical protein
MQLSIRASRGILVSAVAAGLDFGIGLDAS